MMMVWCVWVLFVGFENNWDLGDENLGRELGRFAA